MAISQEKQKLAAVIKAIEAAGYDPIAQLTGYITTGNAAYVTRQGGARTLIINVDQNFIKAYLTAHR